MPQHETIDDLLADLQALPGGCCQEALDWVSEQPSVKNSSGESGRLREASETQSLTSLGVN